MIFQLLFDAFFAVVNTLITFLPTPASLPSGIASAFTAIGSYWTKADYLFPLDTAFSILVLTLGIELAILTFKVVNWGYDKIRGAG